jgi:hypothetical protein
MSKKTVEFEAMGLLSQLESLANTRYDGHLVIMKFPSNWRVSFHPPADLDAIQEMPFGRTFADAAKAAIEAEERRKKPRMASRP